MFPGVITTNQEREFPDDFLTSFEAEVVPVNLVDVCTITADSNFDVDWGDGVWLNYGRKVIKPASAVPTGIIKIRNGFGQDVRHIQFLTNTFSQIIFTKFDTLTSLNSSFLNLINLTVFNMPGPNQITDFTSAWEGCQNLETFPSIDTTSGTLFSRMFMHCISLTCLKNINTLLQTDTTDMFTDTQSLLNPSPNEQDLIVAGYDYNNSNPCFNQIFDVVLEPVNLVDTCTVECNSPFMIDWGDGFWVNANAGQYTNVPTGTIRLVNQEDHEDLTYFRAVSDTYETINIQLSPTLTSFVNSCFGLTKLVDFQVDDFSNVTDFTSAWEGCTSLINFPSIDASASASFSYTWKNCSDLVYLPEIPTHNGLTFVGTYSGCTELTCVNQIDTRNQIDTTDMFLDTPALINPTASEVIVIKAGAFWINAFPCPEHPLYATIVPHNFIDPVRIKCNGDFEVDYGEGWQLYPPDWVANNIPTGDILVRDHIDGAATPVTYIRIYPDNANVKSIDISKSANLTSAEFMCYGLSTLEFFNINDTSRITDFTSAWEGCYNLLSFPSIDVSASTSLYQTWKDCYVLPTFPFIDTSTITELYQTWNNCRALTSFPLIDTSNVTDFRITWQNCQSLTSFPLIDTSNGTDFQQAWSECSSLTSFPLIDTSSATSIASTWNTCTSLTSFPELDMSLNTNLGATWHDCSSLTSFPELDTSQVTNFGSTWRLCSSLTYMPAVDTSKGSTMYDVWRDCTSLACLTNVDTIGATTDGIFDNTPSLVYPNASDQQSIIDGASWTNPGSCPYVPPKTLLMNLSVNAIDEKINITFIGYIDVDWGDGNFLSYESNNSGQDEATLSDYPLGIDIVIRNTDPGEVSQLSLWGPKITTLDILDNNSLTSYEEMCKYLESLTTFASVDTGHITSYKQAFYGCTSLTSFPLIDTSSGTDFNYMFFGCTSLVCLTNIDTTIAIDTGFMFYNCNVLTAPDATDQTAIENGADWTNPGSCP